jgi:hypothetical protein
MNMNVNMDMNMNVRSSFFGNISLSLPLAGKATHCKKKLFLRIVDITEIIALCNLQCFTP